MMIAQGIRAGHALLLIAVVLIIAKTAAAEEAATKVDAEAAAPKGGAFVIQPQLAANVLAIGWEKDNPPLLQEASFGPSLRVGGLWPAFGVYGHAAYASTFQLVGGYSGVQLITVGPDVAPVVYRSADEAWSGYAVIGANVGTAIITNARANRTAVNPALGFLVGFGMRYEDSDLKPAIEGGTRTEMLRDEVSPGERDWFAMSTLYVAANVSFGARAKPHAKRGDPKENGPIAKPPVVATPPQAPQPVEAPKGVAVAPAKEDCSPEARKKAIDAENDVVAKKKALQAAEKEFTVADNKYQDFHKSLPEEVEKWKSDDVKTDDANREAGGKAQQKVIDAKKAYDEAVKEAIRLRAVCDPVIPQPSDNECAATAVRMIVKTKTGKDPGQGFCKQPKAGFGLKPQAAVDLLKKQGIADAAVHGNGTMDDLVKATANGDPVIVSVALGSGQHAIVVDRVISEGDGGYTVIYRDPVNGGSSGIMSGDEFEKKWDDKGKKPFISTNK